MRIYIILAALIAAVAVDASTTASITVSKRGVNEGATFTVDCTIRNLGNNFVQINKRVPGDAEGEYVLTATISTNYFLEPGYEPYKDRYEVTLAEDDEKKKITTFRLTVKNAKVEDSGVYQCSVPNVAQAEKSIVVRAPPKELKLFYYNGTKEHEIKDGDSFTFKEHETAKIKCIVNGSNPEPMARIEIGGRKITKKEGLVIQPPKKYDISDAKEYRIGLVKHKYDTVLEIESLHVMNYGNKILKCAAHTHHLNPPELSKSFTLKMKGMKPVFECNQTQMLYMYQKDAPISCKVHGIPAPDKFTWYTYLGDRKNETYKIVMTEGSREGAYTARTRIDSEGALIMELIVERVHEQHFRRHWFIAENSMGSTEMLINVTADPSVEVVLGGSPSEFSPIVIFSLMLPLLAALFLL